MSYITTILPVYVETTRTLRSLRPREMPFLAELTPSPYAWHGKHKAIRVHSSKNGWAEEWSDRDGEPAVT
jgi:hypothetical protein